MTRELSRRGILKLAAGSAVAAVLAACWGITRLAKSTAEAEPIVAPPAEEPASAPVDLTPHLIPAPVPVPVPVSQPTQTAAAAEDQ